MEDKFLLGLGLFVAIGAMAVRGTIAYRGFRSASRRHKKDE
jgi:hypothetical protein